MKTCLVLGAGASLANARHFHKHNNPELNPPLDNTFFEKIAGLKLTVPSELKAYAEEQLGIDPFLRPRDAPRMEEFFKSLFYDFLQEARPDSKTALAYQQLVRVYVTVLRRTTDWMCADNYRGGPVGRLIAEMAARSETVTVITFNQDLVIENELMKRKLLQSRWCLERGYGSFTEGKTFTSPSSGELFPEHADVTCDHARSITILKPHGSLNWYVRIAGKRPSPHVLRGGSANREVLVTRRRSVPERLNYTIPKKGKKGRSSWYTWPVIIPPIYSKQSLIESFMPTIWADARAAVAGSDRIIFFGYSLPLADIEAEMLFRRALALNKSAGWADVINPDATVAGRFADLAPAKSMRWYANLEGFLSLERR